MESLKALERWRRGNWLIIILSEDSVCFQDITMLRALTLARQTKDNAWT